MLLKDPTLTSLSAHAFNLKYVQWKVHTWHTGDQQVTGAH